MSNFQPLVGGGSETQLQVGENLNSFNNFTTQMLYSCRYSLEYSNVERGDFNICKQI